MTSPYELALQQLQQSELLATGADIDAALDRIAGALTAAYAQSAPLLLTVGGGAIALTGLLLTRLAFPLEYGTLHLTTIQSGGQKDWRVAPSAPVAGRTVIVVDDLLDDGRTMAAIHRRLKEFGAAQVTTVVLCDKVPHPDKPIQADHVGFAAPDRYVFGCGMELDGFWRNLKELRLA